MRGAYLGSARSLLASFKCGSEPFGTLLGSGSFYSAISSVWRQEGPGGLEKENYQISTDHS